MISYDESISTSEGFNALIASIEESGKPRHAMLPLASLAHHPRNPRKKIGDVLELAASVRESGILQPLTVVRDPDYDPDPGQPPFRYLVVIGNRRLEAARKAGLKEVPCIISGMDEATQLATMLAENMQRCDLTIVEQIDGIQQCLDLGMTDAEVKKKTGLSSDTYRKRKKLMSVPDKEAMARGMDRGLSIDDYIAIASLGKENADKVNASIDDGKDIHEIRGFISMLSEGEKFDAWLEKKWKPFASAKGIGKGGTYDSFTWNTEIGTRLMDVTPTCNLEETSIPLPGENEKIKYIVEQHHVAVYLVKPPKEWKSDPSALEKRKEALRKRSEELHEEINRTNAIRLEWLCDYIKALPRGRNDFGKMTRFQVDSETMYRQVVEDFIYGTTAGYMSLPIRKMYEYKRLMQAAQPGLQNTGDEDLYWAAELLLLENDPTLLWFVFWYCKQFRSSSGMDYIYCRQDSSMYMIPLWDEATAMSSKDNGGLYEVLETICGYEPTEDEQALIYGSLPCCSRKVSKKEIDGAGD